MINKEETKLEIGIMAHIAHDDNQHVQEYVNARADGCPPSLLKALEDPYKYELKLKGSENTPIAYAWAQYRGNGWVTIFSDVMPNSRDNRGIDIRISEILWSRDTGH